MKFWLYFFYILSETIWFDRILIKKNNNWLYALGSLLSSWFILKLSCSMNFIRYWFFFSIQIFIIFVAIYMSDHVWLAWLDSLHFKHNLCFICFFWHKHCVFGVGTRVYYENIFFFKLYDKNCEYEYQ